MIAEGGPQPTGVPWLDALLTVAAAVAALGVIGTGLRRFIRGAVRTVRTMYVGAVSVLEVSEALNPTDGTPGVLAVLKDVQDAAQQLRPNSGSTMYDRLGATERQLTTVVDAQRVQDRAHAEHRGAVKQQLADLQHGVNNLRHGEAGLAVLIEAARDDLRTHTESDLHRPKKDDA